jgi:hypothetical protein
MKSRTKKDKVTLIATRVAPPFAKRVHELARAENRTASQVLRMLLERWCREKEASAA